MGCDGGTIPKRCELVREKKKVEKKDKDMERNAKWSSCSITQQSLRRPIVACALGRLYNKEAVLEMLLNKTKKEETNHVRSMSDVKELELTPASSEERKAEFANTFIDPNTSQFVCPVTGQEMNGKYPFCFIWTCGCVLSRKALREVVTSVCFRCGKPFSDDDVISLNPVDDELSTLRARLDARLATKAKSKKSTHLGSNCVTSTPSSSSTDMSTSNSTASTSTANTPGAPPRKKVKLNSVVSSVVACTAESSAKEANTKVAEYNSNTYKSLFTSSSEYKNRPSEKKPHWVTGYAYLM